MKKLSQIILILLFGLNLPGQSIWIDSVYTTPSLLTIEDTALIISEIRTSSAGCDLISTEIDIDELNKKIQITGCYLIGPADTICPSIDTFIRYIYNWTITSGDIQSKFDFERYRDK